MSAGAGDAGVAIPDEGGGALASASGGIPGPASEASEYALGSIPHLVGRAVGAGAVDEGALGTLAEAGSIVEYGVLLAVIAKVVVVWHNKVLIVEVGSGWTDVELNQRAIDGCR